jgi:hypothetical protein
MITIFAQLILVIPLLATAITQKFRVMTVTIVLTTAATHPLDAYTAPLSVMTATFVHLTRATRPRDVFIQISLANARRVAFAQ